MAKEKITGSENNDAQTNEKLFAAYDAVCKAEEKLDNIEKDIEDSIPKKCDFCDVQAVITKLSNIASDLMSVHDVMTSAVSEALSSTVQQATDAVSEVVENVGDAVSDAAESVGDKISGKSKQLSVDQQYTKYLATQIILKKFQIIKYKVEYIKTGIEITTAKMKKSLLKAFLSGKGSASDPTLATASSTIASVAAVVNTIMNVISAIVSVINSVTIMNVNGAGMAFFLTPKSLMKTDINITNINQSTTNFIPAGVDQAITQAEQTVRKSNGAIKLAKIASMGAAGQASAASGEFNPGSFGNLPQFDTAIIKTAVNLLLQALVCAEATPRYEKLSIINVRFLIFLVTGFEPAGKSTFGIPGYP